MRNESGLVDMAEAVSAVKENISGCEVVTLSDGRKVKVAELTGLDEMMASNAMGDIKSVGAGMLQYRQILLAYSIKEVDGEVVKRPKNITEIMAFMAKFKMKDTNKLTKAFSNLNDDLGESQAAE